MKKLFTRVNASTFCETLTDFENCIENKINSTYDYTFDDKDDLENFKNQMVEKLISIAFQDHLKYMSHISFEDMSKQRVSEKDYNFFDSVIQEMYNNIDNDPNIFNTIHNIKNPDNPQEILGTIIFKELEREINATAFVKIK